MSVFKIFLITLSFWSFPFALMAQGTTNAHLSGSVLDEQGNAITDAVVIVEHINSKTQYGTVSDDWGNFYFRNIRVGGPYRVVVSSFGFEDTTEEIEYINLNSNYKTALILSPINIDLDEVLISAKSIVPPLYIHQDFSQNLNQSIINSLPNINNSFISLFELNPLSNGESFSGKNPRFNLTSLDGTIFTNSFGVGNTSILGAATGAQPISLDAIEAVQINLAPYDLSQSGFTGARINTVTKKGENNLNLSAFAKYQDENFVRQTSGNNPTISKPISSIIGGLTLSGPIVKDKVFYFFNYENLRQNQIATNFIARRGSETGSNLSRVKEYDLIALSNFLLDKYNYETGRYQNYQNAINNDKFLLNLDWNINTKQKLNVRYNSLISRQENVLSNSTLGGNGMRNNNPFSMSFENSDWVRRGNLHSLMVELNGQFKHRLSSRISFGFTNFTEEREFNGKLSPLVDILQNGRNYISFGTDPFAANNKLSTTIFQTEGGLHFPFGKHELEAGFNLEHLSYVNTFTPASQGVFVYESLSDFYNSTPFGTTTPTGISSGEGRPASYQIGVSPLQNLPVAKPAVLQIGGYVQDRIKVSKKFQFSIGVRYDRLAYLNKPQRNLDIESLHFQDANGHPLTIRTDQLPEPQNNLSARLGFLIKPSQKGVVQLRGGTGLFLGNIPFVFIADQFQNNGLLYQNFTISNTDEIYFSINPSEYLSTVQGTNTQFDLVAVSPDFNLPKIWRTTFGIAYQFPYDIKSSLDVIYSRDLRAVTISNINLDNQNFGTNPIDGRATLTSNSLNEEVINNALYWNNSNKGRQQGISLGVGKEFGDFANAFFSYTWSQTKEINSIVGTNGTATYTNMAVVGNPNEQPLSFSQNDQPHKLIVFSTFKMPFFKQNPTAISIIAKAIQNGRFSYTYSGVGDVNNDGIAFNDLIFIPSEIGQIPLESYTNEQGQIITEQMQWDALYNFISNSSYLRSRKNSFAEWYGAILPWTLQVDIRVEQKVAVKKNRLSFTLDIINLTNLFQHSWGTVKMPSNPTPIEATSPITFRVYPENLKEEFTTNNDINYLWQIQLGLRYTLNP